MTDQTKITCPGCGAAMELSGDRLKFICPYCGHAQLVENSDEIIKEKIRSEAYTEVAKERLHLEDQWKKENQEREAHNKFRKSFLFVFIIFLTIICALATFMSFLMGSILSGIVGILQMVLLILAALAGTGVIRTRREHLPRMLTIIAALLILLFLACGYYRLVQIDKDDLETRQEQTYLWPTSGLALMLPEPPTQYGEIGSNDSQKFQVTLYQITAEDYQNYVRSCEDAGFTVDETVDSEHMRAHNTDGYYLTVDYQTYDGEQIFVSLEAPIRMSPVDWDTTVEGTAGEYLPEPEMAEDQDGKINANVQYAREKYFTIYIEMTQEQFASYADACIDAGFNKDYSRDETSLYADNGDGYSLSARYRGNHEVEIYVDKL